MIIEFARVPRSGKTSCVNALRADYPIVHYAERFSSVPVPDPVSYDYNQWYLDDVDRRLQDIPDDEQLHVFERAGFDRLVMGNVLARRASWSDAQREQYNTHALSLFPLVQFGFVFLLSPELSLRNARSKKQHFSRTESFLTEAIAEYELQLRRHQPSAHVFSGDYSLEHAARVIRLSIPSLYEKRRSA